MVLTPGAAAAAYSSGEGALIAVDRIDAAAAVAEGPRSGLGAEDYASAIRQWLPHEEVGNEYRLLFISILLMQWVPACSTPAPIFPVP